MPTRLSRKNGPGPNPLRRAVFRHIVSGLLFQGSLVLVVACNPGHNATVASETATTLRADSVQYSVHVNGPVYEAAIGFRFSNNSGHTLSANYCEVPAPPALEKQRD